MGRAITFPVPASTMGHQITSAKFIPLPRRIYQIRADLETAYLGGIFHAHDDSFSESRKGRLNFLRLRIVPWIQQSSHHRFRDTQLARELAVVHPVLAHRHVKSQFWSYIERNLNHVTPFAPRGLRDIDSSNDSSGESATKAIGGLHQRVFSGVPAGNRLGYIRKSNRERPVVFRRKFGWIRKVEYGQVLLEILCSESELLQHG